LTEKEEKDFMHGLKKCAPSLREILQAKRDRQESLGSVPSIVPKSDLEKFATVYHTLKTHFPGRNSSTGRDAMIYKSFNTYTELLIEAACLFADQ
jgi:hypothetical protein